LRLVVAKQLVEFDLTMMEWLLLATVCAGPKEGMTMTSVAEALDVTLPQITALTNSLVKTKLVRQKVSSQDRRSRRLTCTISGRRLIMRVEEAMNVSMEKWLSGIPREQLETYIETVEKLAKLPTDFEKG
jgi:DNA-binding MarR family transcriptional regulator